MLFLARKLLIPVVVLAAVCVLWGSSGAKPEATSSVPSSGSASEAPPSPPGPWLRTGPLVQRLLVWILLVLLAPILTVPLANRVFDERSNAANFFLLAGYVVFDTLAALLLNLVCLGGILVGALCLAGLAAAAFYNYRVCTFLERLREG